MKKFFATGMVLLSGMVLANGTTQTPPMLKAGVYDISNKVARDTGDTYSISNKNLRLCWAAFNMPFEVGNQNKIVQVFVAPNNKAKFSNPNGSTAVSKDGKTSTVTSMKASRNNEVIEECWQFDNTDPLGKYTLSVQVNNVAFGAYQFELVK